MAVSGATFVTSSRRGALLATAWMLGDRPPSSFLGQFADTLLNNPLGRKRRCAADRGRSDRVRYPRERHDDQSSSRGNLFVSGPEKKPPSTSFDSSNIAFIFAGNPFAADEA
jgi:hypothetical protein